MADDSYKYNFIIDDLESLKLTGQFYEENISDAQIPVEVLALISKEQVLKYHIIPLAMQNDVIYLVTDKTDVIQYPARLENILRHKVKIHLADRDNVCKAIKAFYDYEISDYANARISRNNAAIVDLSPLQRQVDDILQFAASIKGSDIHVKAGTNGVYVWIRVNGELKDFSSRFDLHVEESSYITNIFKGRDTSDKADSANQLMPNNGAFEIQHAGVPIRCRLATVPVGTAGDLTQKVDVRLMPQNSERISLDMLYSGKDLETIQSVLFKSANGMFINSGPVGSGKTTSLYAQIEYLVQMAKSHNNVLHVFTIENPVEIVDKRYTQVQIRETKDEETNLSALTALDAALRSDPDILLFGEVRNKSEAEAAMKASQTGLKLFTTLHAGNCKKTILRLLNLDIDPLSMLSEMRFIICQRLIPILCPECSKPHQLTEQEVKILNKTELDYLSQPSSKLREKGSPADISACTCSKCRNGIIGRISVPEYIVFDNDIRDALLHQSDFFSVDKILEEKHFVSMRKKGLRLVADGEAELSEVLNRIGKED